MLDIDNLPIGCVIIRRWGDGEFWVMKFLGKSHSSYFKCFVIRHLRESNNSVNKALKDIHKKIYPEYEESIDTEEYSSKLGFKDKIHLSWDIIMEFLNNKHFK